MSSPVQPVEVEVPVTVKTDKVPKLAGKYQKFAMFVLWLSKKQGFAELTTLCNFKAPVDEQSAFYAEFEAAEKDLRKELNKLSKPEKVKATRVPKKNKVLAMPRDGGDLLNELVRLASSDDLPIDNIDTANNTDDKASIPALKVAKKADAADKKAAKEKDAADKKAAKEKEAADKKAAKEKDAADKKAAKEKEAADKKAAKAKDTADKKPAKDKDAADKKAANAKDTAHKKPAHVKDSKPSLNHLPENHEHEHAEIDVEIISIDGVDFALDPAQNLLFHPISGILLAKYDPSTLSAFTL